MYTPRLSQTPTTRLGLRPSSKSSPTSIPPSPTLSTTSAISSAPSSPSRSLFSLLSPTKRPYFLRRKKSLVEMELEEERQNISNSLVSLVEPRPQTSEGEVMFGGIEEIMFDGRL